MQRRMFTNMQEYARVFAQHDKHVQKYWINPPILFGPGRNKKQSNTPTVSQNDYKTDDMREYFGLYV